MMEALPSPPMDYTPAHFRGIRESYGLSQAAFATMLGVSRRTVQRKEAGDEEITLLERWALEAVHRLTPCQRRKQNP